MQTLEPRSITRPGSPECDVFVNTTESEFLTIEQVKKLVYHEEAERGYWYHATTAAFDAFTLDPPARRTDDWNARLGIHLCRDGEGVYDYICFEPGSRVIETTLELKNPWRSVSEFDLDRIALQLRRAQGLFDPEALIREAELLPCEAERYCDWIRTGSEDLDQACHFRSLTFNWSGRAEQTARIVRDFMRVGGFDGILYGNEIDFPSVCAIAFEVEQVSVSEWNWLRNEHPNSLFA